MKKFICPYLFLLIKNGELVIWNYKDHSQYVIEESYLTRLLEISKDPLSTSSIDDELLEDGLISTNPPDELHWEWDELAKIFLLGTQNVPLSHDTSDYAKHFSQYLAFCEQNKHDAPDLFTEKAGKEIILPPPELNRLSSITLWDALKQRKTSRSFDKKAISLETVSTLLHITFGIIHSQCSDLEEFGIDKFSLRKSSPSVGGLHCAEAYLFSSNVTGLAPGVYHYQCHNHKLTQIRESNYSSQMSAILCGQNFAEALPFGIAITARLDKCWHKYKHSRALQALLIDIGHLSQTFQLCATGMKLNPWLTGIFSDQSLINILRLEGTSEYPFFFIGAGYGDGHSLSQEMRELLKNPGREK